MDEKGNLDDSTRKEFEEKSIALQNEIKNLHQRGFSNIYFISNKELSAPDHEGTVDGVHFTDMQAMRFAKCLATKFKKLRLLNY